MTKEDYKKKYLYFNKLIQKTRIVVIAVSVLTEILTKILKIETEIGLIFWMITLFVIGGTEIFLSYFIFKGEYCRYKMRYSGIIKLYGKQAKRRALFSFITGLFFIVIASFMAYILFIM